MADNVCAVVGVGPGVGLAVARRFAQAGYTLALSARNPDKLAGFVNEFADAHAFPADAGDPESLRAAFEQIQTQLGRVDVLVYNIGIMVEALPSQIDPVQVMTEFQINVLGALVCAQQVIPGMRDRRSGTILITGGGLALYPTPQYASLALDKAALRNLTFSLAAELAPANIQVGMVTIAGLVAPNTPFDPDRIAEAYWQLHTEPADQSEHEIIFRGAD